MYLDLIMAFHSRLSAYFDDFEKEVTL